MNSLTLLLFALLICQANTFELRGKGEASALINGEVEKLGYGGAFGNNKHETHSTSADTESKLEQPVAHSFEKTKHETHSTKHEQRNAHAGILSSTSDEFHDTEVRFQGGRKMDDDDDEIDDEMQKQMKERRVALGYDGDVGEHRHGNANHPSGDQVMRNADTLDRTRQDERMSQIERNASELSDEERKAFHEDLQFLESTDVIADKEYDINHHGSGCGELYKMIQNIRSFSQSNESVDKVEKKGFVQGIPFFSRSQKGLFSFIQKCEELGGIWKPWTCCYFSKPKECGARVDFKNSQGNDLEDINLLHRCSSFATQTPNFLNKEEVEKLMGPNLMGLSTEAQNQVQSLLNGGEGVSVYMPKRFCHNMTKSVWITQRLQSMDPDHV
eukprot:g719.t1